MPADATIVSLRSEAAEAPAARHDVPRKQPQPSPREQPEQPRREQPERPIERSLQPKKPPQSARRRWPRWALFALLPLALIAGGYWYVTGGGVMSTDNAYVEADKVGISTDVSSMVKEIDVKNNQHVEDGQVLFRLDDLPFRLALERAGPLCSGVEAPDVVLSGALAIFRACEVHAPEYPPGAIFR